MKVVVISHSAVVALYRQKFHALARRGCDLHLVLPPGWPEGGRWVAAPPPGPEAGITLHSLPAGAIGRVGGFYLRGLGALVRKLKPDIIQVEEEPYALVCAQALRAARRERAALVFFTWENILRKYKLPLNWIDQWVLRRAEWAIAGNQEARDVLSQRGYHGHCAIIPQYGVDPEIFKPQPALEKERGVFTIGYFGRLLEEKGIVTLLRAVKILEFPWRLIIIGSGPHGPRLADEVEALQLAGQVKFSPVMGNDQVPAALGRLDALVLPSETRPQWKEQFGRILIEAMACEIPVVGSDSGEIPHVIGEAGLVFPETQANRLAEQLSRLQADPALAVKLGKQGRQRVLANFTTEQIAQQTFELYQRMLAAKGA